MSASREKKKRKEAVAAGGTAKQKKNEKRLSSKAKDIIKYAASIVVILAVFLVIVVNSGVLEQKAVAATVGSEKVTAPVFNYYYYDTLNTVYSNLYSTYGDYTSYFIDIYSSLKDQSYYGDSSITWDDYLCDTALNSAQQVAILTDAANEDGYTLTDEDNASVESAISSLESYAVYYSYTTQAYLDNNYGKGSSLDTYREYLTANILAASYSSYLSDNMNYSDDEINSYYSENSNDFDTVTYRSYYVAMVDTHAEGEEHSDDEDTTAMMEEASVKADDMAAASLGNEQKFIEMAYELADADNKETYADDDATLNNNKSYSSVNSTFVAWLFDQSRTPGETTKIESGSGYYVLWFSSRNTNDYNMVDVRHILFMPEESDDEEESEALWAAALELAEQCYSDWQDGDQTEDSFAALANERSEDGGSNTNGGLYEDVAKGQMVQEFEDWCFDPLRQIGDTGIVKTDYGYHIMYYSGTGDLYRETNVISALKSDEYAAWLQDRIDSYPITEKSIGMYFTNRS